MRQAGRYMPEYRALRTKYDFLTLMQTPELATEVTLQPIDILGVDAAILFSDILVIPQAMGMELQFIKSRGPVFSEPVRDRDAIQALKPVVPEQDLDYVLESVRLTRHELADRVPLIGFAGTPWTLAAYMVEGQGSRDFTALRRLLYQDSDTLRLLLEKLATAVALYLEAKVRAGAQAIQLFDTWGGLLTREAYERYSLPTLKHIITHLHANCSVPVILFSKGRSRDLDLQVASGADVLSLDWTIPMAVARHEIGSQVALQGNLDPAALYAPLGLLRREAEVVLDAFDGAPGHIFNLGHGISPDMPVEHVQALVEYVHDRKQRGQRIVTREL